jgi:hypothetical protein
MTDAGIEKDEVKIRVDADTRQVLDDIVGRLSQALRSKPHWAEALRVELRDAAVQVLRESGSEIAKKTEERLGLEEARYGRLLRETADKVEGLLRCRPEWTEPFRADLRDAVFDAFRETTESIVSRVEKRLAENALQIAADLVELSEAQEERLQRVEEAVRQVARPWYKKIGG